MKSFLGDSDEELDDSSPLFQDVYHELVEESEYTAVIPEADMPVISVTDHTPAHEQTMFVVVGVYESTNEKIIHLWRGLEYPCYEVHLRGRWFLSPVALYDLVFINAEWNDSYSTILDNTRGILVLYPHITLAATRLSAARQCLRRGHLLFMFPGGLLPNSAMVYGTIAHEIVQRALEGFTGCESAESMQQIASKHAELVTVANVEQEQLVEKLKNDIAPIVTQVETMRQRQTEPHIEEIDGGTPPYGCDVIDEEKPLYSYTYGLNGIVDVMLSDGGKVFPMELKSGSSSQLYGSLSHVGQLSAYILMMKDKYREMAHNFGALYYMGNNRSIKVEPSFGQLQALISLRNDLISSHIHGRLPECQQNLEECKRCDSLEACQFMMTGDIESLGERRRFDFYRRIDGSLLASLRRESSRQSSIWLMSPEERIKMGTAIGNLHLTKLGENEYEILSDGFAQSAFRISSVFLLTKGGKPPILGRGNIVMILEYGAVVTFSDFQANETDEDLFIDLFDSNHHIGISRGNMIHMFAYLQGDRREKFLSLIVDGRPPSFRRDRFTLTLPGMNKSQLAAIQKGLCVKDYLVIDGMRRTGKTRTLAIIISHLAQRGKKVLVIGSSVAAIDSLCLVLIGIVDFLRVSDSPIVHPLLSEHTLAALTARIEDQSELASAIGRYNVFATSLRNARHKILRIIDFDVAIFEDAESITLCDAAGVISLSKSFILTGDTKLASPDSLILHLSEMHPESVAHLDHAYDIPSDVFMFLDEFVYCRSHHHSESATKLSLDYSILEGFEAIHPLWVVPMLQSHSSLHICNVSESSLAISIASMIAACVVISSGSCDHVSINAIGGEFNSLDVIRSSLCRYLGDFVDIVDISRARVAKFNRFCYQPCVYVNVVIVGNRYDYRDLVSCLGVSSNKTFLIMDNPAVTTPLVSTLIATFGDVDIPAALTSP